ncbi:hypothetical protein CWI38_0817p0010 [Hamiltosporidium tvaerminnensis]|uniref:Uncharacterized protein n=1 Tax=Hamiltosporidium tvaerminnensis TaxID=1176355 RepID=A0A4Q9LX23_9MICR|nr:hypothetical protein CWI38_0817p0010 [Hamiltosporidium tvaerminnensis]
MYFRKILLYDYYSLIIFLFLTCKSSNNSGHVNEIHRRVGDRAQRIRYDLQHARHNNLPSKRYIRRYNPTGSGSQSFSCSGYINRNMPFQESSSQVFETKSGPRSINPPLLFSTNAPHQYSQMQFVNATSNLNSIHSVSALPNSSFFPPGRFNSTQNTLHMASGSTYNHNTINNLCFPPPFINPLPQTLFLKKLYDVIIKVLKYPTLGKFSDISIFFTSEYFFEDILNRSCLIGYFRTLKNLVAIEKEIININSEKKKEFEQAFLINITKIDLEGANTNILFHVPMLITLKNFISKQLERNTSDKKYHVSIFFGLKLIESVIKKTHLAIYGTLNSPENIQLSFDPYRNNFIRTNSNIILEIIDWIFTLSFSFNETFKNAFVSIINMQKNKSLDVLNNPEGLFGIYDLSFLPDIFFLLEESEIKEIYEFNRLVLGYCNDDSRAENHGPIDLLRRNKFAIENERIIKMIGYYFIIFENFEIDFFKQRTSDNLVMNRYELLKEEFQEFKQKKMPLNPREILGLRKLFYATHFLFYDVIAILYNRNIYTTIIPPQ